MGIFDSMTGGDTGLTANLFRGNPLLGLVMNLLHQKGGITGLLQGFQSQGMGNIVQSWISTGPNLPISPEQLRSGLGEDTIRHFSSQTGMDGGLVSEKLAGFLPEIISRLTPNGQIPSGPIDESQFASSGLTGIIGGFIGDEKKGA